MVGADSILILSFILFWALELGPATLIITRNDLFLGTYSMHNTQGVFKVHSVHCNFSIDSISERAYALFCSVCFLLSKAFPGGFPWADPEILLGFASVMAIIMNDHVSTLKGL